MRSDGREELLQPTLGAGQGPSPGRKGPVGAGVRAWVGAAGPQLCKHGSSGCSGGSRASGLSSQAPEVIPAGRPSFTQRCWGRAWQDPPLAPDTTGRMDGPVAIVASPLRDTGALLCPEDGRSAISAGTTAYPPEVPQVLLVGPGYLP